MIDRRDVTWRLCINKLTNWQDSQTNLTYFISHIYIFTYDPSARTAWLTETHLPTRFVSMLQRKTTFMYMYVNIYRIFIYICVFTYIYMGYLFLYIFMYMYMGYLFIFIYVHIYVNLFIYVIRRYTRVHIYLSSLL